MSRITVGVNLLWLVPGQVGGSEQSTVATLRGLRASLPDDVDLRLFVLEPFLEAHADLAAAYPTEALPASGRSRPARVLAEATWLAGRTRGLSLAHHAGGTAPLVRTSPYVLTLHDLQPLEQGGTHGRGKRAYLRLVVPGALRRARAVAVPSEFVRQSVLARYRVAPERVVTIPHGCDWPPTAGTSAEVLRRRHHLDGPVVLYPAITYPHKNHATLVDAFALVRAEHPDARLVLTGAPDACESALAAQIQQLGLTGAVCRLGRVSEADKVGLFDLATVVAVPSTYEGFGLPAVEAMMARVPLVAARATALPEVVGDAGLLVDPHDPEAWAEAIGGLLSNPARRDQLVERGEVQARRHSLRANAEAFIALYRQAAGAR